MPGAIRAVRMASAMPVRLNRAMAKAPGSPRSSASPVEPAATTMLFHVNVKNGFFRNTSR